ncbi:MAG: hypothetical protein BYD32DRAFT_461724 [Podila humilis]|nr:MAG: hypothetical protein BYD32DRAFT_461724 [Podila humilis]
MTLSNNKDLALLEIAKRVVKFKEDIKRALRLHLTDDLFDKVTWSHLPMSLVKIGLAKDYKTAIAQTPVEDQTWEKAIKALHKSIKFEPVSSKVADIVTKMHPERGETMRTFLDRLLLLMEAANMDDSDCSWLVKLLGCYLSDVGMQATMNKYKSLDNIKSIKEYLEFLHETPGAVEGNRTDHTAWFLSQFKADVNEALEVSVIDIFVVIEQLIRIITETIDDIRDHDLLAVETTATTRIIVSMSPKIVAWITVVKTITEKVVVTTTCTSNRTIAKTTVVIG